MRVKMLERIHESHMGIEKSKRRVRDIMFWPRMNEQIEAVVSKCKNLPRIPDVQGRRYRGGEGGGCNTPPPNNSNVGQSWSKWN